MIQGQSETGGCKHAIALFGSILRMRNLLISFDDFAGKELLSERDLQDYLGRYQDLRDEWRRKREGGEKEDITDDVVFEVVLEVVFLEAVFFAPALEVDVFLETRLGTTLSRTSPTLS